MNGTGDGSAQPWRLLSTVRILLAILREIS
jgi:hypothetical protein